jgi:hypothetical protein
MVYLYLLSWSSVEGGILHSKHCMIVNERHLHSVIVQLFSFEFNNTRLKITFSSSRWQVPCVFNYFFTTN